MRLSGLYLYPVKSLGGIQVNQWPLDELGLALDRRWMVVDREGRFLTQRQHPKMALIRPALDDEGRLTLRHPKLPALHVPPAPVEAATMAVQVWQDRVEALRVGDAPDTWLRRALGIHCHLVWLPPGTHRAVDPEYAPGAITSFTDGFPLLLIGEGSLAELNARLQQPVSMRRFRPNLVVSGSEPFAEDHWRRIRIGQVEMEVVKPCSRCVVTTVDPDTGIPQGPEPLRTLATFRRRDNKVYFGQNVVHRGPGRLRVGDTVQVIA